MTGGIERLTPPPEITPVESAIEHCELMIEESIAAQLAIDSGRSPEKPSYRGNEYDDAYAQGRKDACRVILLCLGVEGSVTSDDVKRR